MKYEVGATSSFKAYFFASGDDPAVLDAPPEIIFISDDLAQTTVADLDVVISAVAAGEWEATVIFPDATPLGRYQARWTATIEDQPVFGVEIFDLVEPGSTVILDPERDLRRRLRDRLVTPPDDADAFFMNDEIHSLLAMNNFDVVGAAYDGWMIRAAHYSDHVDINESGSDRRLSQMFKNAMAMADFYRKARDGASSSASAAMAGRVVGSVVNLRGEYLDTFGLLASAGYRAGQPQGAYVRIFPLYRFMGLLNRSVGV